MNTKMIGSIDDLAAREAAKLPEADMPTPTDAHGQSDDALAIAIGANGLRDNWRFIAPWNQWMTWRGTHWEQDSKLEIMTLTRDQLREIAKGEKDADKIKSASTVAAVERLMRSNSDVAATSDQWDADPWLLGTPSGTVDLRTGELRDARRDEYISKRTAATPASGDCPQWRAFLARIFRGHPDIVPFLQRGAGYALTGQTSEHKLLFAFGTGRNGKSVFLNTLCGLMGDYATIAPSSTFLDSGLEGHPTDLASLAGARLVTANELPPGKAWNESRIKSLTGGDPVTARRMRQDFFTFTPQFTLLIAGNHLPRFRGIDEAIRARMILIPFDEVIPIAERDTHLSEKLQAEWPMILQWAIDGAVAWQRDGLDAPPEVCAASNTYLDDEDSLGDFLTECLKQTPGGFVTRAEVYGAYRAWAETQGSRPWTQGALTQALIERGLPVKRTAGARGFMGHVLKNDRPPRADEYARSKWGA